MGRAASGSLDHPEPETAQQLAAPAPKSSIGRFIVHLPTLPRPLSVVPSRCYRRSNSLTRWGRVTRIPPSLPSVRSTRSLLKFYSYHEHRLVSRTARTLDSARKSPGPFAPKNQGRHQREQTPPTLDSAPMVPHRFRALAIKGGELTRCGRGPWPAQ